ncbi:MAG: recombinase RecA [Lachnospiraceae bacterium]|nr:recombinase RecA [Lachnospiraceae bacterium]
MAQDDKLKALDAALTQIEKQFGKGAVMKLGDTGTHMNIETTPTGSLSLDIALGLGGIPKGRIVEIYGPESSGKTTVALHMVAEVQKRGGIAGFIDAEHALDPVYAKNIGVDIDNLYISQPDNGEQGLEITETMVRSGAVDIIIVDSVAALVPKAEIEGDMGDAHVGLQARLMSQALRKLTGVISKSNCTVIFINQLREKVGIMFGNPETTTGGRALKFYSSIRLDVRRTESLKQSGEAIGNHVKVKVVKNKIAPPFREAEFDIMFGKGISREGDILDLAANNNIINKSGAWYAYEGNKIGQGRENAKLYLKEHPDIMEEVDRKVRQHYGLIEADEKDGDSAAGKSAEAGKTTAAAKPVSASTAASGRAGTASARAASAAGTGRSNIAQTGSNAAPASAGAEAGSFSSENDAAGMPASGSSVSPKTE